MAEPVMVLTHLPVMARGLGPAIVAELSGLPWKGPRDTGFKADQWPELRDSGRCPLGQLPMLEVGGFSICQPIAIVNYIGKNVGMEGADMIEYATSQALLSEAESLYGALSRFQPTADIEMQEAMCSVSRDLRSGPSGQYVSKNGQSQVGALDLDDESTGMTTFWKDVLRARLETLERLLENQTKFTSSGTTVGELQLWSVLHQLRLCAPEAFFADAPCLQAFYQGLEKHEGVDRVVSGQSTFGPINQYFVKSVTSQTKSGRANCTTM